MAWTKNEWGEWIWRQTASDLDMPVRRATRTVDASSEPISLAEAKAQVRVSGSEHDDQLNMLIEAARIAWEHDTGRRLIQQTFVLDEPYLHELRFHEYPVSSISSIQYYDVDNAQQTLSTDYYELDTAENALRLKPDQDWPSTYTRYDAATITYVAGNNTSSVTVSPLEKAAMLQTVAHLFYYPVDGFEKLSGDAITTYQLMVHRYMRSSYP